MTEYDLLKTELLAARATLNAAIARLEAMEAREVQATQPSLPPGVPEPPEGYVFVGRGPLKAQRSDGDKGIAFYDPWPPGRWLIGVCGDSKRFYALRRGSEIARANGIG